MTKSELLNFKKFYSIMNENNDMFSQKIKVVSKKISEGKEKTDKDGNPIFNATTGQVDKWDDSYYITFLSLNGGSSHAAKVTQEFYEKLEIGKVYIASGRVDYVTYKDSFNSIPVVIFENFEDFESYLVAQLEISNSSKEP